MTQAAIQEADIISATSVSQRLKECQELKKASFLLKSEASAFSKKELCVELNKYIFSRSALPVSKDVNNFPLYKYLSLQELGRMKKRLFLESLCASALLSLKKLSAMIAEKVSLACILGAVVGARLADVLFYQHFSDLLRDPLLIVRIWQGGLASHGGVVGVVFALYFVAKKLKKRPLELSLLQILDLASTPAMFAAAMIRMGNFMNQEILGKVTDVPWAVVFGHPADGSAPMPRHPCQIYEMLCYVAIFVFLSLRWKRFFRLSNPGRVFGLMLAAVFTLRFLIEFFKEEQSVYLGGRSFWTMGQFLSIPLILVGFFLFFRKQK